MGRCGFVNNQWGVDAAQLRSGVGFSNVDLINDFEATACSLSQLLPSDLLAVGRGRPVSDAPKAVIGPGADLGVIVYPNVAFLGLQSLAQRKRRDS